MTQSINTVHLYLLSPLHTGGTTQEGNLLGIARESHTNFPYIPSSTIRGKLRSSESDKTKQYRLFGNEFNNNNSSENQQDSENQKNSENKLTQGHIWIGDGSILWIPIPSLSHGVVWVTSPMLLSRWARFNQPSATIPDQYRTNLKQGNTNVYLKDAILKSGDLEDWQDWKKFVPENTVTSQIKQVLVLPDRHCSTIIQMSLWRQVKIKLDSSKSVDGGFRYEEAIPPDTLMYFPWGITSQANGSGDESQEDFKALLVANSILQIGGQESLGRGFVQQWMTQN